MKKITFKKYKLDIPDGVQYFLKRGRYYILEVSISKNYRWFRLFGVGLHAKHIRNGLMFSERNGYSKYIVVGKWIIKYLKK